MIQVVSTDQRIDRIDLPIASRLTGLHRELILEFTRASWIAVSASTIDAEEPIFDGQGVRRLRQIAELQYRQRMSFRMVRTIVCLLHRLDEAERELRFCRE
jgi:hypothetical protein